MKRSSTLPYKTLTSTHVELAPWHYRVNEDLFIRIEKSIPGWDYKLPLSFARNFCLNEPEMKVECGLPPKSIIAIAITVRSPEARYSEVLRYAPLKPGSLIEASISTDVISAFLAKSLTLHTEIVLHTPSPSKNPFSAHLKGSRLFEETFKIEIEGTGSRFPVESSDFETDLAYLEAPDAKYYLKWSNDALELPAMSGMILLLNNRFPDFIKEASDPGSLVSRFLTADVARQLISGAIENPDFVQNPKGYAKNTLGAVIYGLINVTFQGMSINEIKNLQNGQTAKFEAMIQNSCGF